MASVTINNTLFTGKFLVRETSMPSTNEYAKNLLSKTNPTHGTVIITDFQHKGKGQGSNEWQTEAGKNITCSVIYDTSCLKVTHQYYLNMAVAVAVRQTVQQSSAGSLVEIKWPNDILCGRRKIAGILIENTVKGYALGYSVIGIGLNINQLNFRQLPFATSLAIEANEQFNLEEVLSALCQQLERQYFRLREGNFELIRAEYNRYLFGKESEMEWRYRGENISGTPIEVQPDGRLEAKVGAQRLKFSFGELEWTSFLSEQ